MKAYKRLVIWKLADKLTRETYKHTENFPKSEQYAFTSQLRRASLSVVLNIIEGYARRSDWDFRRFLDISLGSLAEVEYLLELALDLSYLDKKQYDFLENIRDECGKCLWSYRKKLKK